MRNFFDFRSRLVMSTVQAHAIDLKKDENGTANEWNLIKGIYGKIKFPVNFKQDTGNNFADILDTGWPSLHLISDRLNSILKDNGLTGWQTFPIKLYDKRGKEITGYRGFSIIGQCGPKNYDSCEIIEKTLVPNGPICRYCRGVSIDEWDGSDFFTPEGSYSIIITKKAADVLKNSKVTNLSIVNLADEETDIYNVQRKN